MGVQHRHAGLQQARPVRHLHHELGAERCPTRAAFEVRGLGGVHDLAHGVTRPALAFASTMYKSDRARLQALGRSEPMKFKQIGQRERDSFHTGCARR